MFMTLLEYKLMGEIPLFSYLGKYVVLKAYMKHL